jgi:hypothetical protein
MSKQPIVDWMPFRIDPEQLNESARNNNGRLIVSGVMQRAEAKNQNGRIYPKNILERERKKYTENFISKQMAYGELDHPSSSTVSLKNTSHIVLEMNWNGNDMVGKVEILPTPSGKILESILKAGKTVGISSRGVGSVKEITEGEGKGGLLIQDDFELIAFDFVSNPSTHEAFMYQIAEGKVTEEQKHHSNLNKIMSEIISDIEKLEK